MADEAEQEAGVISSGEISKNALKKQLKAEEAAKKKAAKEVEKAAKKAAEPEKSTKIGAEEEELDPTKYYENRLKVITNMEVCQYTHYFIRI